MPHLVRNTLVDGHGWWGPAHGRTDPPPEIAELITNPLCWDTPPGIVDASGTEDPNGDVQGAADGAAGSGADGDGVVPAPEPDPEPSTPDLEQLDRVALLALARERGVEVGERWGEKRLRAALRPEGG